MRNRVAVLIFGIEFITPLLFGFPTPGPQPTDLNFDQLYAVSRAALDTADLNLGVLDELECRSRHSSADSIELRVVGPVTYALFTGLAGHKRVVALSRIAGLASNAFSERFELTSIPLLDVAVHAGYWELSQLLISDRVTRLSPGQSIVLIGISQGGACAAILPLVLAESGIEVEQVVTLGQPRAGDSRLAQPMRAIPVLRLIAGDDQAPSYPQPEGYAHFGRAVLLLDGPFESSLCPGQPGYESVPALPLGFPDCLARDHLTYDVRLESKVGVNVYQLPLADAPTPDQESAALAKRHHRIRALSVDSR